MVNPELALAIFFGTLLVLVIVLKLKIWAAIFPDKGQKNKVLKENILKHLFHIEHNGGMTEINDVVKVLKIVDKKCFDLIERMTQDHLIEFSQNTIKLTPAGRAYALKIIRVHRLWEKYLSEKTGIHKGEWHDRAELMEHTITSEQADKLYQELGSPRFDPHGDPIPTATGELIGSDWKQLSSLSTGMRASILHIEDEPGVIYQQIIAKNLHIGSHLRVIEANEHQIHFYCEGNEYTLSTLVASNVNVKELSDDEVFKEFQVRLTSLSNDEKATIVGLSPECRGANRRRLLDLGFIKGTPIQIEYPGPMENPKAYLIKNTLIALRKDQAEFILIEKE